MARRATAIAQQRQQNPFVLVLDAGDSLVGDQDPARRTQGASSIEAMNRLGYDASALGLADLSLGLSVLRQRSAEAKFDLLSANAVVSSTGEMLFRPYVLRRIAGHRIALVGLSNGPGTAGIAVRDPVAAAQTAVAAARQEADIVLLLSHAGPATDRRIAAEVMGLAAIIGGGTAVLAEPWVSPTGVPAFYADQPSPGHAGRYLGIATLSFDAQGKLLGHRWQRLALGPEIADDPALAAWVQEQSKP